MAAGEAAADGRTECSVENPQDSYVDESWYLAAYPDVREGVRTGRQRSAREHYLAYGRAEGRKAFAFDEDWYIGTNPDVQLALSDGTIRSARDHYVTHGRFENRSPVPPSLAPQRRTFAFGAYGTNNVGDEAIFEGLKLQYPDVVQIFHHRQTCERAIKIEFALRYRRLFQSDSRLIIGGGGLLYSRSAVADMVSLAESARAAGARVDVLGLGCEGAQGDYREEIRRLVASAQRITVRTRTSAEILRTITGREAEVQADFAFNLARELPARKWTADATPLIGVVTGGDVREDYSDLVAAINSRLSGPPQRRARFVHIPHSMSFDDRYNNDLLVGSALWCDLSLDKLKHDDSFRLEPFRADPRAVLEVYAQLDGVMTSRFHGMVFAEMMGLPVLSLAARTLKNRAFMLDHGRPQLFAPSGNGGLQNAFEEFFLAVKQGARFNGQSKDKPMSSSPHE